MRSHLVEVAPPSRDHDLALGMRQESFEAQALVAELAVEAFGRTPFSTACRDRSGRSRYLGRLSTSAVC
jgi:hypothetical protein